MPKSPSRALVCARRAREQEVGGLDVAMDHAAGVGVVEGFGDIADDVHGALRWHGAASLGGVGVGAVHELHGDPQLAVGGLPAVEDGNDVRMSLIAWLPCEAMPVNWLRSSVTASATARLALLFARQWSWASSKRSFPTRKRSSMSSAVRPWFRDPNWVRGFCTCSASRPLTSAWSDQYVLPAVGSVGGAGHHAPTNSRDHSPGGRSVTAQTPHYLILGVRIVDCCHELRI